MKVYIGKYRYHWLSPYTIAEKICFWRKIKYDEPWVRKFSKTMHPVMHFIKNVLDAIHPRIEYVKIDEWDVWSMDTTLAPIILSMLKQLKVIQQGHPVDLTEKQWKKILDKMIWSFEATTNPNGFYGFKFKTYGKRDYKNYQKHMDKVQEGYELFGKHYMSLWD